LQNACQIPKIDEWIVYFSSEHAIILYRINGRKIEYAPLFSLKLKVNNYNHYSFNAFNEIDDTTFGGAIKKSRIEKHLLIKDMAKAINISRDSYMRLEQNKIELYDMDKLNNLFKTLDLKAEKICTPYQLFLMKNQGEQILKYRKDNNLSQNALADMLGTSRQCIGAYEKNKNRMLYDIWVKFDNLRNQ
jgi:DNA-binding XRE family transcriptional regulator